MKCDRRMMRLYAVTDRAWLGEKTLCQQVEEALEGGVTCLQLREKELPKKDFLCEAIEVQKLCKKHNVAFIVNDDVDIAIKSGADGVHVGQGDMECSEVRRMIGANMLLGVSVQTVEQAVRAQESGADYLGVGAVFSTGTKPDADAVSIDTLKDICTAVSIPVVAIGGISEHNILKLSGSGIDGVAVVSAIFASDDIKSACRRLLDLSEKITTGKEV